MLHGITDIGKPAGDDPYYKEIVEEYKTTLKKELRKNGFFVVEEPTPQSLVIKTKIGDDPPPLGGVLGIWTAGMVAVQIEIFAKGQKVLYFEGAVITDFFHKAKKTNPENSSSWHR